METNDDEDYSDFLDKAINHFSQSQNSQNKSMQQSQTQKFQRQCSQGSQGHKSEIESNLNNSGFSSHSASRKSYHKKNQTPGKQKENCKKRKSKLLIVEVKENLKQTIVVITKNGIRPYMKFVVHCLNYKHNLLKIWDFVVIPITKVISCVLLLLKNILGWYI